MTSASVGQGRASVHATAFLVLLAACGGGGARPTPSEFVPDVTITVNPQVTFQSIDGFGTSTRVFDDPHVTETFDPLTMRGAVVVPPADQEEILDALYVDLGLTRVRFNTDANIEPTNDNDDPLVTDLARFNFEWKRNDAQIDLLKRLLPRGVTTHFLSPVYVESWMNESNPEEYVEWAMAILRRWRAAGVEPPFYSILNEPGYDRGGIWSAEYVRDVTSLLGSTLEAEGFGTKLVVPDDLNPDEAERRATVIMADASAAPHVGALAYHLYGGSSAAQESIKALAAVHGVPVWMTEYAEAQPYEWALITHDLLAHRGVSAVDSMWGFFGQWDIPTAHLIEVRYAGATYIGWQPTKSYYYVGQFSRFVRPGAVRVEASTSDSRVLVTGFATADDVVVVLINDSSQPKTAEVLVSGRVLQGIASAERTSASENWTSVGSLQVVDSGFRVELPAYSVTTVSASR